MWKWVLVLCVGMYVVLMAFGGDGYDPDDVARESTPVAEPVEQVIASDSVVAPAPVTPEPEPEVIATPATAPLPAPTAPIATPVEETSIAAIAPVAEPITITPVPQATVTQPSTVVDDPNPELPIWRVTGSRVNLRAEANAQARILGRTVRGDSAEIIEMLPNGWAKVYILESGIEAYMSAAFIEPDQ